MSSINYDSRTADKFVARLPDGLRSEIEVEAKASDRSMNAVFIQAVRQYLDGQKRQRLLLDALANAAAAPSQMVVNCRHPGSLITENPVVAESPYSKIRSINIDQWIRTVANARRYEWLRDGALGTGSVNVPMVRLGAGDPIGGARLDEEVDAAAPEWPIHDDFAEESRP